MISLNSFIQLDALSGTTIFILITVELIWLWSVICVARERTDDPTDRIVWLMIVLFLNILGTVLYMLFAPSDMTASSKRKQPWQETENTSTLRHLGK